MSPPAYEVRPQARPFDGPPVEVPGSKSITNRALICAALAEGRTVLRGALFSDDSKWMAESLRKLGFNVMEDAAAKAIGVDGLGGELPAESPAKRGEPLFVGNAGTAARFLPCLVALEGGDARFTAEPRMSERPMAELLGVLKEQGAEIAPDPGGPGGPQGYPFRLRGHGLKGGAVNLDLSRSTQFASGLLMAAPCAKSPMAITASGDRQQLPYVDTTAAVMAQFGVACRKEGAAYHVPRGHYRSPGDYLVEPDISAACYFFAATALIGGKVTVLGTSASSMQGDIRFLKVLQHLGCSFYQDGLGLTLEKDPSKPLKGGLKVDMNAFSDQALTLAALAPFCDGPVTITGIAHSRKQESDRVHAIAANLAALGVPCEEREDGVTISPATPKGAQLDSFGDHRVAMAFSLVGLRTPGVRIGDPGCVAKTFEGYWQALEAFQAGRQP